MIYSAIKSKKLWRLKNTSEDLTNPRVMARVFVETGKLEESVRFYEELQKVKGDAFFPFPEHSLQLAMVGSFLIIEGSKESLAPFLTTQTTFLVNDVQPYYDYLTSRGCEIIFPLQQVPTGKAFNVIHLDGTVVEYVHHRPNSENK